MSFKYCAGQGRSCEVPSGTGGAYGYAKETVFASHRSIESHRYTGCNGIITFEPSTSTYTLSHFPPGGPTGGERAAYIRFLKENTKAGSSYFWVVGSFTTRLADTAEVPKTTASILAEALFTLPASVQFTGPRGRACDVLCHSAGLTITTRGPDSTTVVSWGMGLAPGVSMTV
jgi:hypothetical protein